MSNETIKKRLLNSIYRIGEQEKFVDPKKPFHIVIYNNDTGELFTKMCLTYDTLGRLLVSLDWHNVSWDYASISDVEHLERIKKRASTYGVSVHGGWLQGGENNG